MSKKFFEIMEYLNLTENRFKCFDNGIIENILINSDRTKIKIILTLTEIVSENLVRDFEKYLLEKMKAYKKVEVFIKYSIENMEDSLKLYMSNLIASFKNSSPLEYSVLENSKWEINSNNIFINSDKNSCFVLKIQGTSLKMKRIIMDKFGFEPKIEIIEVEKRRKNIDKSFVIKQDIENNYKDDIKSENLENIPTLKPNSYNKDSNIKGQKLYPKKRVKARQGVNIVDSIEGENTLLKYELNQDSEIIIAGEIFDLDERELRNGNIIVSLDISDGTNAVTVKFFINPDVFKEEFSSVVKKGNYVKIKGVIRYDDYAKELNIMANEICKYEPKKNKKTDDAELKRIELHLHTNMSSMDGLTNIKDYVKRAKEYGHSAIGLTDHGVVQAYPDAMDISDSTGVKILYGIEAYIVDDTDTVVSMCKNQTIDDEFVIFDIETTGLSSMNCKIIEIGAVKVKNRKIIEKFSYLINPEESLSEKIVELTNITDSMLKDKPTIDYVLPKFIDFIGESVLVAHNVNFDIGFLNKFANKIMDFHIKNTFIDTVMLSRMIYPDIKNHKLDTIVKHLNISLINHHRAIDDAIATSDIFIIELKKLEEMGIKNLSEINNKALDCIPKKTLRPYHGIIYVKNKDGLKNLYKLVSDAHINNFFRRPRILKSKLNELRDGLILGSACEAGEVFKSVIGNMPMDYILEKCNYYDYLEVQPIGNNMYLYRNKTVNSIEDLCYLNMEIIRYGEIANKLVVATGDVHFMDKEDELYRRILMTAEGFKDAQEQPPLYYRTTEEMLKEFEYLDTDKAYEIVVTNTNKIADLMEDILPIPKETSPPKIEGSDEELRNITISKAKEIYGDILPEIVEERLERELNSIIKNGFSVMYIIAQKLVWNSLEAGYLVGSRGSVGSSLVATMASITEVNPLHPHYICSNCKYSDFDSEEVKSYSGWAGYDMPDKICPKCGEKLNKDGHDIPFETFLGFDGDKEPDIDLNFSSEYQANAHAYTEELFGEGYVFKAGTIGTLADKTAAGFVLKYVEENEIVARRAEIKRLAKGCTGVKKTTGQHPGGLMVVPNYTSIYNFTPIQRPANDMKSTVTTTHFDYHSISGRLLKLDILGHTAPTIIKMLHESTGIDPLTVDLGDKAVMSLFQNPSALGIKPGEIKCPTGSLGLPELGTSFVRQMLIDTKPSTFTELVRISGLSHGTDVWRNNAQDLIKEGTVTLKDVIATRDDIMVYLIFSGVEKKTAFFIMEKVRKGKGLTEEDEKIMLDCNIPKWYIKSCKTIKYLFPKGHAVAYVLMSVRIAYFKINYPEHFYAATFSISSEDFDFEIMCRGIESVQREMSRISSLGNEKSNKEKSSYELLELVEEMYVRGVKMLPVDLYKSQSKKFLVTDEGLLPPLCTIQGLGGNAADSIVHEREIDTFTTIEEFRKRTKVNKNVIEIMKNNNILGDMPETSQLSLF